MAIENAPYVIGEIPEHFITDDQYETVIITDSSLIQKIPQSRLTYKMCEMSVDASGLNIQYVTRKYVTQKLCLIVAKTKNEKLCAIKK